MPLDVPFKFEAEIVIAAGSFEAVVHDPRVLLRWAAGRAYDPTAVILDARTVQGTPECGARAGYDGHKTM